MICEHHEYEGGCSFGPKEDSVKSLAFLRGMGENPVKCCEIEGKDWFDCLAKYHEHMGWGPYERPAWAEEEKRE